MNTLNTVPSSGTYGDSVSVINNNFALVKEAVDEVGAIAGKGKGAYQSLSDLQTKYPTSSDGDWAIVYNSTSNGYDMYTYSDASSTWGKGGVFDANIMTDFMTQLETGISGAISDAEDAISSAEQSAIDHISEYGGVEVVQETGDSTTAVMSQASVTKILGSDPITEDVTSLFTVAETGKKIYNGEIVTASGALYTNPVTFHAGETLHIYHTNIYIFGSDVQTFSYLEDGVYKTLFSLTSGNTPIPETGATFSYTFLEDRNVILSIKSTSLSPVAIKRTTAVSDGRPFFWEYQNRMIYKYNTVPSVGAIFNPTSVFQNIYNNDTSMCRFFAEVEEGEEYIFANPYQYRPNSGDDSWCITDAEFNILICNKTDVIVSDWLITVPANGEYLFCSSRSTSKFFKKVSADEYKTFLAEQDDYEEVESDTVQVQSTYTKKSAQNRNQQGFTFPDVGETFTAANSQQLGVPYCIEVDGGDELIIYSSSKGGYLASNNWTYIVVDNRNVVIEKFTDSLNLLAYWLYGFRLTIPDGGAFLVFNADLDTVVKRKKRGFAIPSNESVIASIASRVISNASNGVAGRFCLSWTSDTHNDVRRYREWVDFTNRYRGYFDAALHTGDANRMSDSDGGYYNTVGTYPLDIPLLYAIGNHDAFGQSNSTPALVSGSQLWNGTNYCAPFFDDTIVASDDKCNFYRDFTAKKIRLIVLNDYDQPRWVNTTNWETTTDSDEIASAVEWVEGTSYAVGDIVNYKGLYLKCKVAGIINDNGTDWSRAATIPRGPYDSLCTYWQQEKIDFFLSALNVQSDWSIIIASHMPMELLPSDTSLIIDKWTYEKNSTIQSIGVSFGQNGYILQDILSAYLNRTSINNTYKAITPNSNPASGTLINQTDFLPDVTVSANFSSAVGDVICYLHGHQHCDSAFFSAHISNKKLLTIGNINNIYKAPDQSFPWFSGDIIKGGLNSKESFNVISFDTTEKNVYILRVGANVTDSLNVRDYIKISYAH